MCIGAEAVGCDITCGRRRHHDGAFAQGDPQRLLQAHRGRQRERPSAAEHLLQRRQAELGLLRQRLPGDPASGELLANGLRNLAALLVSFEPGWSATTEQASLLQPGDAKSGSLLLKEDGAYTEAIRLGIDVDITVSGPTLRARVTQVFRNPTKDWVEATYVYPLPTGGAVDTLKMVVGDRVIVGDIKERQQARVIYEEARRAGQKAALTEQERPNIFTNSVANIGPG